MPRSLNAVLHSACIRCCGPLVPAVPGQARGSNESHNHGGRQEKAGIPGEAGLRATECACLHCQCHRLRGGIPAGEGGCPGGRVYRAKAAARARGHGAALQAQPAAPQRTACVASLGQEGCGGRLRCSAGARGRAVAAPAAPALTEMPPRPTQAAGKQAARRCIHIYCRRCCRTSTSRLAWFSHGCATCTT